VKTAPNAGRIVARIVSIAAGTAGTFGLTVGKIGARTGPTAARIGAIGGTIGARTAASGTAAGANDNRYDWQRYRYANRNIFRPGRYYSPYNNYGYSRFSIGLRLGSGYYSNRYWINDPWAYRLPPAYAGTRWIRYYNDVLLVDMYSGEVIDVIYDFFW
jgi:Ni/Co efflux regulator RcnB